MVRKPIQTKDKLIHRDRRTGVHSVTFHIVHILSVKIRKVLPIVLKVHVVNISSRSPSRLRRVFVFNGCLEIATVLKLLIVTI